MRLALEIEMDNAAFKNHNGHECARILQTLQDRLTGNPLEIGDRFTLCDINGNTVGKAVVFKQ